MRTSSIALGWVGLLTLGVLLSACSGCNRSTPETQQETAGQLPVSHVHAVAGETCFICDASKRQPGRLWCREHARYEDRCWECQPQLEDKDRLFCEEHALYEDECFLCHPELEPAGEEAEAPRTEGSASSAPAQGMGVASGLFCNEHQVPERECGICQPQRTAELEPGDELKVRFESVSAAAKAGLRTASPVTTELQASLGAVCEVRYNDNLVARITPLAPGIVRRVFVDVGADVAAGDVLVEIHSAEIAAAKTAFISAAVEAELMRFSFERQEELAARNLSSQQDIQEATAAHKIASLALSTSRQRLLNYGISESEITRIEESQDGSATLLVRAPYAGSVVQRDAVVGEAIEPGESLFTLADLSTMWLSLSVPAGGAHVLRRGLPVVATLSGLPGAAVRGELTWVNTSIDERSRMVQARALVPNDQRTLKAGMFGEARVLLAANGPALSVPEAAVQHFENHPYVFVKHADDLYGFRRVVVARAADGRFAVTAGLHANEPVIVEGAFTAMSEFLKSRLGAGCVDD